MSDEEKIAWFKNALGFVLWCRDNSKSNDFMLSQLLHDIAGICNDDPCFFPRLTDYSRYGFN